MKICVVGLGIIGGSLCMALKRAGYAVAGWNRSQNALDFALENKIIDERAHGFLNYDVVFIALPPETTLNFINSNSFKDGAVVADICGVKKYIADGVGGVRRNFRYVGCHPMAGKEVSGIENACADLFDRASMVITSDCSTDEEALALIRRLTTDMGFKYIVECSPEVHDKKIAYTSQLAHVVSNAYVKSDELGGCIGFTGGSFQDMTRIAGVDEEVWSSLYLLNAENLSEKISSLISALGEIKSAVDSGDAQLLKAVLKEGKRRFTSGEDASARDGIKITKLK